VISDEYLTDMRLGGMHAAMRLFRGRHPATRWCINRQLAARGQLDIIVALPKSAAN
jgi:hypothetical protein